MDQVALQSLKGVGGSETLKPTKRSGWVGNPKRSGWETPRSGWVETFIPRKEWVGGKPRTLKGVGWGTQGVGEWETLKP